MARYRVIGNCFVGEGIGRVTASINNPQEITVSDDYEPSKTWKPLDEGAQEAMRRMEAANKEKEALAAMGPMAPMMTGAIAMGQMAREPMYRGKPLQAEKVDPEHLYPSGPVPTSGEGQEINPGGKPPAEPMQPPQRGGKR